MQAKRKHWETKTRQNKTCDWIHFGLVIYCLARDLLLSEVCIPSETSLKKTEFSSVNSYQLEISSRLGIATCVHFSSQHWDTIGLNLCSHCVCCYSFFEFTCASVLCIWKALLTQPLPSPLAFLIFLPPLLQSFLSPVGRDLIETFQIGLCVSYYLHSVHLWSLCFFSFIAKGNFSDDGWGRHGSMSIDIDMCHFVVMFL